MRLNVWLGNHVTSAARGTLLPWRLPEAPATRVRAIWTLRALAAIARAPWHGGSADESVAYAAMERAAPAIRSARIVPLEGGRHFLLSDSPDVFVREVEQFLSSRD